MLATNRRLEAARLLRGQPLRPEEVAEIGRSCRAEYTEDHGKERMRADYRHYLAERRDQSHERNQSVGQPLQTTFLGWGSASLPLPIEVVQRHVGRCGLEPSKKVGSEEASSEFSVSEVEAAGVVLPGGVPYDPPCGGKLHNICCLSIAPCRRKFDLIVAGMRALCDDIGPRCKDGEVLIMVESVRHDPAGGGVVAQRSRIFTIIALHMGSPVCQTLARCTPVCGDGHTPRDIMGEAKLPLPLLLKIGSRPSRVAPATQVIDMMASDELALHLAQGQDDLITVQELSYSIPQDVSLNLVASFGGELRRLFAPAMRAAEPRKSAARRTGLEGLPCDDPLHAKRRQLPRPPQPKRAGKRGPRLNRHDGEAPPLDDVAEAGYYHGGGGDDGEDAEGDIGLESMLEEVLLEGGGVSFPGSDEAELGEAIAADLGAFLEIAAAAVGHTMTVASSC